MAPPPLFSADRAGSALDAYEALAAFYDDFTGGYQHEKWLAAIEGLAGAHGVTGGRLLDVACGTGKSSAPLLAGGWEVWACDLSPAMVQAARSRLGVGHRRCFVADMCELPPVGPFDLVLCLDDSLNYLTDDGQLSWALASCASVLAPGGLLIFDVNTLRTYRTVFASEFSRTGELGRYTWRGLGDGSAGEGRHFAAEVEVAPNQAGRLAAAHRHEQRHYSRPTVEAVARSVGLEVVACHGQSAGARLHPHADENTHSKFVYALRRPNREEAPMIVNP